ncbi:G-protein alpha subunit-domain-containing protein [Mycena albidolilacea]|uniref:G-protein alpha subunit-domain-containing protein n=1 Tax=Mycena albidolilacea TaxID=1033008 RepID=A0AAD6YXC2_9AGAR|nr:G-protein alpha subunit-domain-containing protein [Mycena albidolilacea]
MPLHPVSGGGFSIIGYLPGEFNKEAVCIKVLRIFTTELQLNKIYKELARKVLIWKELSHPNVLPLLCIDLTTRKPSCWANILINDGGQACLADFGLALAIESQALSTSSAGGTRGTLRWLAPEILDSSRKTERQASLTKRDIYALGCTILEIYTGGPPFPNLHHVEVIHHVVTKREHPEIPSNAVAQLKDLHQLLKCCWHNKPRERPNATEISNILQLEPSEWKKAVAGLTLPFWMFRRPSALLGRSPRISPTPRSPSVSVTSPISFITTQFTSESESARVPVKILLLGSGQSGKVRHFLREISHAIKMLSQDPGVREAISRFSEFQLSDSAEYFFNSIERLAAENYIPTTEDILHLRVKTTGVYQKEVEFDGQTLIIRDTSGERCERKKWVHCFPGTTAVFFLVALNDYQNVVALPHRMNNNFELWPTVINSKQLKSAKFILLFNKLDLFICDFQVETFSAFFPDYISWKTSAELFTGGNEVLKALAFLRLKFLGEVHTYEVSATDTDQFRDVWDAVKKIIL